MKMISVVVAFLFFLGASAVVGASALPLPGVQNDAVASADGNAEKTTGKKQEKKKDEKKEVKKENQKKENK
jgi:ribosomal protein L12E/L44/L45/RPP1/RPP2